MGSFDYDGYRFHYRSYGSGDRVLVLTHGLLMNHRMYDRAAPEIASRGNRVICVDLLGHGESDAPDDLRFFSMTAFADQIAALLDHLEVEQAVIGGTSLGANVSLEFGARHRERAKGLFIEMPVLEHALVTVALLFTPVLVGTQLAGGPLGALAAFARRIPRSHYLVDILLDWVRRDPGSSTNVLQGLLLGRSSPTRPERVEIAVPTLVVGHPNDPLHPFSDSDTLVDEMPNARLVDAQSILEWRIAPSRLDEELARFLDEVWEAAAEPAAAASGSSEGP